MVRRPDTDSSEELSQSQNAADEGRRSAQADGEEEEEESEVERTQVARGLLGGDEDEEEEDNDDDDEGGSIHDRKRARLENGDIKDEEVRVKAEKPRKMGMLPRHADGYVQTVNMAMMYVDKNMIYVLGIDTFLAQLCE